MFFFKLFFLDELLINNIINLFLIDCYIYIWKEIKCFGNLLYWFGMYDVLIFLVIVVVVLFVLYLVLMLYSKM